MRTGARYQAVYEILCAVFEDVRPADRILNEYFRARQYIGSKDRRFIAQTVWDIIRRRCRLSFEADTSDVRKILLVYLKDTDSDLYTDDSPYSLAPLTKDEKIWLKHLPDRPYPEHIENECPLFLYEKIANPIAVQYLNQPAGADLRVNMADRESVRRRLQREGLFFAPTPYSPYGLRSEERVNLNNCVAYHEGLVEVQDESCQVGALLCAVRSDEKVIDYCAGAGGKSLAIAAYNHNEGQIEAHDKNINRTDAIKARAERLGIRNIRLIRKVEDFDYDCFIVDAPCSGSGTWRRSPDAKFRLSAEKIAELTKIQAQILETAAKHTKSGGRIVYMTCSVLPDENENIVLDFIRRHTEFTFADHQALWQRILNTRYPFNEKRFIRFAPHLTHTDGFFFCTLYRK